MSKRATIAGTVAVLGGAALAAFWILTAPQGLDAAQAGALEAGNAARGERIFWAGGCSSCHAAERAQGGSRLRLGGGLGLKTPFGTFVAPNISPHPTDGIGAWSPQNFATAMLKGVSPDGAHYYPAFPYASYARMAPGDVADLYAFLRTLPAVEGRAAPHAIGFPFNVRRGLGLWKRLYLSSAPVIALADDASAELRLGRYIVEGPGHCGECHTPRTAIGGTRKDRWLAGAPAAEGTGSVPNITSGEGGIGGWSQGDLEAYFETGFTPDFDTAGGVMAEVQQNLARLPPTDRSAIAAYLKAVPPQPSETAAPTAR